MTQTKRFKEALAFSCEGFFYVQSVHTFVQYVYTSNPYKHWKNVVCSVQTH